MTVVDRSVIADPTPIRDPSTSTVSRPRRRMDLFSLAGASVALVGAGIGAQRLSDNSFLTHLASGREMIEHGFIRSDGFTWTSAGESIQITAANCQVTIIISILFLSTKESRDLYRGWSVQKLPCL